MFTKSRHPEVQTREPIAPIPQDAPKLAPAPNRACRSLIAAEFKMTGSIVSRGELDINGAIEGDVRASVINIGEAGSIRGEVIAETIVVHGAIEGSIRGRRVQLCASARVRGDIFHTSLAIEANAMFEGLAKYSQDPTAEQPAATRLTTVR